MELDVRTLYLKDLSLLGCTVLASDVFTNLVCLIEQENISPVVAQSFHLEDIAKAQAFFQEKRHVGKVVLEVNSD